MADKEAEEDSLMKLQEAAEEVAPSEVAAVVPEVEEAAEVVEIREKQA